jgi:superfamily II DNA or RNA helicase
MRNFKDLDINIRYKTNESDSILKDFYIPILSESKLYKRAVGYFSSNILVEYIQALECFIKNGGKMKLLISPFITESDYKAIEKNYNDNKFFNEYVNDLISNNFLNNEITIKSTEILIVLIQLNILDIRIAVPKNKIGLFHDKIGIFVDKENNYIAISGSNNETLNATSFNHESFSVFCNWKSGQEEYVDTYNNDFEAIWNKFDSKLKIFTLNEAFLKNVLVKVDNEVDINNLFLEFKNIIDQSKNSIDERDKLLVNYNKLGFTPYDYQEEAVLKLINQKKGILKFCTAAGKTKTAVTFIMEFITRYKKGFFVIVVPDKTLTIQWYKEISIYHNDVITAFSDNANWLTELKNRIDYYNEMFSNFEVVIVTTNSFSTDKFQNQLAKLKSNFVLIVDECHTVGTELMLGKLPTVDYRLGLSATPEIHNSPELTEKLFNYFNGIIMEYTLEDGIRDGKLVEYYYYPIIIGLSTTEKDEYLDLSKKIAKAMSTKKTKDNKEKDNLDVLIFQRSRIIYAAENKLKYLEKNVANIAKNGFLLIYCGTTSQSDFGLKQIEEVNQLLSNLGIVSAQYTQSETGEERENYLSLFKQGTINTLVAIKCLDEGVDIKEIKQAIIMASSTNPREFVQRRGRLLRKDNNKKYSVIFDLIVLEKGKSFRSLNSNEIDRLIEFGRISKNRDQVLEILQTIEEEYLSD